MPHDAAQHTSATGGGAWLLLALRRPLIAASSGLAAPSLRTPNAQTSSNLPPLSMHPTSDGAVHTRPKALIAAGQQLRGPPRRKRHPGPPHVPHDDLQHARPLMRPREHSGMPRSMGGGACGGGGEVLSAAAPWLVPSEDAPLMKAMDKKAKSETLMARHALRPRTSVCAITSCPPSAGTSTRSCEEGESGTSSTPSSAGGASAAGANVARGVYAEALAIAMGRCGSCSDVGLTAAGRAVSVAVGKIRDGRLLPPTPPTRLPTD